MHQDVLLLGHQFFVLHAVRVGDLQSHLALGFLAEGDRARLFGQDADILGRPGLEQLSHPRQAAGDVACLLAFDRDPRQHLARGQVQAIAHLDQRTHRESDGHRVVGAGDLDLVAQRIEQLDLRPDHLGHAAALAVDDNQR